MYFIRHRMNGAGFLKNSGNSENMLYNKKQKNEWQK